MGRLPLPVTQNPTIDVAALRDALSHTGADVHFDRLHRALYSTDASVYQIVPLGVVLPRSEADMVAIVKECARFRVPLTARGGGTGTNGQSLTTDIVHRLTIERAGAR